MRRVLLIGNIGSELGGSQTVCEELGRRLPRFGWRTTVVSGQRSQVVRLLHMAAAAATLARRIDVAQIDVYDGRALRYAEATSRILCWANVPVVLTLHGGSLPDHGRRDPRRLSRLLNRASAVTAPSGYMAKEMASLTRNRIHVVPNGISTAVYRPSDLSSVRPSIVWVRRFNRIYDPALAVETLKLVREAFPDATLTMIGPDDHDGSLAATLDCRDSYGLADAIDIRGRIPKQDIPKELVLHGIFLNTTTIDNAPVSVVEGMAAGLCVVSTNAGGIPDLLEDERTALLAPVGDAEALAAGVKRLLHDPEFADRLRQNSLTYAQEFDWETKVIPGWVELFEDVITEHR